MVDEAQRQRTNFRNINPNDFIEPYRPDFNKKPLKDFPTGIMLAMNNNPAMNKIKNSTSTYILVLVTTLPVKKIKSIPEVMNKFGMSTEKN